MLLESCMLGGRVHIGTNSHSGRVCVCLASPCEWSGLLLASSVSLSAQHATACCSDEVLPERNPILQAPPRLAYIFRLGCFAATTCLLLSSGGNTDCPHMWLLQCTLLLPSTVVAALFAIGACMLRCALSHSVFFVW